MASMIYDMGIYSYEHMCLNLSPYIEGPWSRAPRLNALIAWGAWGGWAPLGHWASGALERGLVFLGSWNPWIFHGCLADLWVVGLGALGTFRPWGARKGWKPWGYYGHRGLGAFGAGRQWGRGPCSLRGLWGFAPPPSRHFWVSKAGALKA